MATEVVEVKSAAELSGQAPKFVPSQADLQPPMDDNMVKAIFDQAAKNGSEDLNVSIPFPTPPGQSGAAAPTQSLPVPEKFKKPDGTVDEDKLKASSEQLDKANEQKKKTVDDLLAEYKEKERQFQGLSQAKVDTQKKIQSIPVIPPPQELPQTPDFAALQAQIHQDYQRDPIQTSVMLAQAIADKKIAETIGPLREAIQGWQEKERDAAMRENLSHLAQSDPRILDPRNYSVVSQILEEDPGMFRLKNPYKAAWNEAKDRLRLGEPSPANAQPSNPSPMLGGGVPPSVSTLPQPLSTQNLYQQAQSLNPYSDEGKRLEEALREVTRNMWQ